MRWFMSIMAVWGMVVFGVLWTESLSQSGTKGTIFMVAAAITGFAAGATIAAAGIEWGEWRVKRAYRDMDR